MFRFFCFPHGLFTCNQHATMQLCNQSPLLNALGQYHQNPKPQCFQYQNVIPCLQILCPYVVKENTVSVDCTRKIIKWKDYWFHLKRFRKWCRCFVSRTITKMKSVLSHWLFYDTREAAVKNVLSCEKLKVECTLQEALWLWFVYKKMKATHSGSVKRCRCRSW